MLANLATRLIDKLTVDGPDFEKIYEADGDLSRVYPQDYSGIDTTSAVAAVTTESSVETKAEEPAEEFGGIEVKPTQTGYGSDDDSNDPGPSD